MLLRQEDCCLAIWLNALLSQVLSPRPASTSAAGTRRSTTPRGGTASTSRTMTLGRCWHGAECKWLAQRRCLFLPPRNLDEGVVRLIEDAQAEIDLLRDAVTCGLNDVGARCCRYSVARDGKEQCPDSISMQCLPVKLGFSWSRANGTE